MKKLSKPQARIIGGNKPGEKLFSNPSYNTEQRSIDTLVKHGHLALTDRQPGGFNEYTVQDTPEVRACNAERDAAYAAIMADDAAHAGACLPAFHPDEAWTRIAAIAQPVSVATDAAPAWTPDRAYEPEIDDDDARYLGAPLPTGGVPAPDAAQTAVTVSDLPPFAPSETDYANAMKLIDQQVEQIATLTRERDAAKAEADALRKRIAFMPKYRIGQTVSVSDWSSSVGTIEEIHINSNGIEYSVYVEGESMAYTWAEGKVTPLETDAALVAARQRADDGTRLTTADVIAQSEFAPED